jgi:hypothetical protein
MAYDGVVPVAKNRDLVALNESLSLLLDIRPGRFFLEAVNVDLPTGNLEGG